MIVTPEALDRASIRWKYRHGNVSKFESTVTFLSRAKSLSDITQPAEDFPFGALHHHLPADFYDVIDEADIVLMFRVLRAEEGRLEIEIVDRGRFRRLTRAYLARRASAVHRNRLDAETAVANSANVVAVAAGAAGVVAVVRNIIGIVKDSLDIGRYLRSHVQHKKNGDQS
jgi:hypothetical protein